MVLLSTRTSSTLGLACMVRARAYRTSVRMLPWRLRLTARYNRGRLHSRVCRLAHNDSADAFAVCINAARRSRAALAAANARRGCRPRTRRSRHRVGRDAAGFAAHFAATYRHVTTWRSDMRPTYASSSWFEHSFHDAPRRHDSTPWRMVCFRSDRFTGFATPRELKLCDALVYQPALL